MNIEEHTQNISNDVEPKKAIRLGGKQKSGNAPLKHVNFYFQIGLNQPSTEELKNKVKGVLQTFSEKIENELLIIEGSDQGLKQFNLPVKDEKDKLKIRIVKSGVKYSFEINPRNLLVLHYCFSVSKRALNTQLINNDVKAEFEKLFGAEVSIKGYIFRDAKADISVYSKKHPIQ